MHEFDFPDLQLPVFGDTQNAVSPSGFLSVQQLCCCPLGVLVIMENYMNSKRVDSVYCELLNPCSFPSELQVQGSGLEASLLLGDAW